MDTSGVLVGQGAILKIPRLINLKEFSKIFIITDPRVNKYHFKKVKQAISQKIIKIVIPKGESAKNIAVVEKIWQKLLLAGCDRKSLIINLGGGVIGDVGGFAASTFMRGVAFVQIPTTLLAQVDASLGGKVGVNFAGVKNLIGTFNQPLAVLCDINFLATLPNREFIEGFAEAIKHGIIADKKYFDFVTSKKPGSFNQQELVKIVLGSVKIKAGIVSEDEKEAGRRRLLNFGHTIGHAIEALSQQTASSLLHGEAISIGMVAEARISQHMGLISEAEVNRIIKALSLAGLPIQMPDLSTKTILAKIKSDKKSEGGEINWTLISAIGKGIINQRVNGEILKTLL